MFRNKILFICSFVILSSKVLAQIVVDNTLTPAEIVNQVLLGSGVTATNITFQGPTGANVVQTNVATYACPTNPTFPIQNGILLTTGNSSVAPGPNNATAAFNNTTSNVVDPDLAILSAGGVIRNGAVLEFDFIPQGDSIKFDYIFASEEYPEFAPPNFGVNDVFGFFLSGPGISGTFSSSAINIATLPIPGDIGVSINNVNAVTNTSFYRNNLGGLAWGSALQYDGSTTLLTARALVQCGQTYHIKIAIVNIQDNGYDSGVLLQANSFSSNLITLTSPISPNTDVSNDSLTAERCEQDTLYFVRPNTPISVGVALTLPYVVSGTATNGVDYAALSGSVTFPIGQDSVAVIIDPTIDAFTEGIETVILSVTVLNVCGQPVTSTARSYIYDLPPIMVTANNTTACSGVNTSSTAVASGGFQPYTYSWNTTPAQTSAIGNLVAGAGNGTIVSYVVTATDVCGYTKTDTVTVTTSPAPNILSVTSSPTSCSTNNGQVSATIDAPPLPGGILATSTWASGSFTGPSIVTGTTSNNNLSPGTYYFTISYPNGCKDTASVVVQTSNAPVAQFTATPTTGSKPLVVSVVNSSTNATEYAWDFGNGQTSNLENPPSQTYNYDDAPNGAGTYQICLTASLAGGTCPNLVCTTIQVDTLEIPPVVIPPVIIPPLPLFFELGNVFTPNGDNINDVFKPTLINAKGFELTIFNRWGGIIYKGSGLAAAWDGTSNGTKVVDGTYFYKATVYGFQNEKEEVQGFLSLSGVQ